MYYPIAVAVAAVPKMPALFCREQNAAKCLFDHLVGADEQRGVAR